MSLPSQMRAVEITQPGGPEMLSPTTRPVPVPAAGEVLIKVAVAGVNRPDVVQRQGLYPPPPGASDLPGLEVSGTIAALGPDVTGWQVGDKVCALLGGGGYAEYATAPAGQVLPVPDGLDMVQAAALPETVFTVWTNVVERAGLTAGESFLVHGGTSGIGTIAIQVAKALGATVFATAGGSDKVAACRDLGADHAIDYKTQDFVAVVKEATGKRGVDVVLDMVGGDYLPRNIDCLAVDGRHVTIAFLRGPKVELNLAPVMLKRLTLTGSTLRARSTAQKAALAAAVKDRVWPLVTAGKVRPVIAATFPLEAAADAHRLMESSTHIGKIMLVL
ncbi:NAD(P)H-quinone oxidoreductase [Niveispirillum sp.]|uniref:NAD(P)H-quinone oxidoreductase n=1 Tax=Niveispirillum sp. TaxID=1917217 RepID=UPI001B6C7D99|nr:NAD(P)H-quinone oxidoreductase [Niveispirillum sp.]MBP7336237.1 NAD(P)H-quinone oxidoreductase [Niveispirillum sp.]